jgi:hypothetical protein
MKLGGTIFLKKFNAKAFLSVLILCVFSGCASRSPNPPHASPSDSILLQDGKLLYELGRVDEAKGKLELVLVRTSDERLKALAHHYMELIRAGIRPDFKRDSREPRCFL